MSFLFRRHERKHEANEPDLHLVVGLGNPGGKYEATRHNVGFMIAERLGEDNRFAIRKSKQRAEVGRGKIGGVPALIALPLTFMNESGNAVSRLLSYYHVSAGNLLVVTDDMDLPFGTLRLRPGGSAAGHNGLRSIEQAIGTSEFARLRFGIGRPEGDRAIPHVLSRFTAQEMKQLPSLIETAAEAVTVTLNDGVDVAMNRFNRSYPPEGK